MPKMATMLREKVSPSGAPCPSRDSTVRDGTVTVSGVVVAFQSTSGMGSGAGPLLAFAVRARCGRVVTRGIVSLDRLDPRANLMKPGTTGREAEVQEVSRGARL